LGNKILLKKIGSFLLVLCIGASSCGRVSSLQKKLIQTKRWFILLNYDPSRNEVREEEALKFDMAIFDADAHPPLESLKGKMLLIGYVSAGEAESYRFYWEKIKGAPWILGENPDWKENYRVDVRSAAWQELLLEEVIPGVMAQGFDGIMLDTLDTADYLEETFPGKYPGAKKAMAGLVRQIRRKYPGLLLISNNGFSVLEEIAPSLNGMLVEDVYRMPDFTKGGYGEVPEEDRRYKVEILNKIQKSRKLPVFNVDYTAQEDKKNIRECIQKSKALGFKPYIAEKNLSKLYRQD